MAKSSNRSVMGLVGLADSERYPGLKYPTGEAGNPPVKNKQKFQFVFNFKKGVWISFVFKLFFILFFKLLSIYIIRTSYLKV